MKTDTFCAALVKAFDNIQPDAENSLSDVKGSRSVSGAARSVYADHSWVSLSLRSAIGEIESIHVMPHRFNIDTRSGNFHHFANEIQFVACAHGVSPRGPGTESAPKTGVVIHPERYHPALNLMKKREDPTLTVTNSLDQSGNLSVVFVEELEEFLKKLKTTDLN